MGEDDKDEMGEEEEDENKGRDLDVEILGIEDEEDEGEGEGEDDEGGDEGEGGKEEKNEAAPAPTFQELLAEAKRQLKEEGVEETKKDPKHPYTLEELDQAEDRLAQLMKDEEIEFTDYHRYMKNIERFRKAMEQEALVLNLETRRKKQSAEESLVQWAKGNAPEYLDSRTKATKDALAWAEDALGAEKRGDVWMVPAKVGNIMFGVLHRGNQSAKDEGKLDDKKGGGKGEKSKEYEKGMKDAQKRDAELRGRDSKIPKSKVSSKEPPPTEKEREVMETLGLTDIKRYRAMKKASEGKLSVMQVK